MHRLTAPRRSFLADTDLDATFKNLYLQTSLGPIDVLGSVLGVGDFQRVRKHAIEVDLFGHRCRVMSLDDLIMAKEALGRDKDILAVKELRAIVAKQVGK
jgi:predicted nucleotidyltransferase